MDFFETPEEVARQLEDARGRLKDFEDSVDSSVLLGRLRAAHPFHPTVLARVMFLLLGLLVGMAAIGLGAAPFALGPDEMPAQLLRLERNLGVPLPLAVGILSGLCFVAWFGASQAALLVARECPLMPNEQRDHERLVNEVKRLSSQKAIMDRVRGTPMGARPRTATPAPISRFAGTPGSAPGRPLGNSTGGQPPRLSAPSSRPAARSYTPPMDIADNAPTPRPAPQRGGTPLGAPPRAGSVVGQSLPGESARPGSLNSSRSIVRPGTVESKRPGALDSKPLVVPSALGAGRPAPGDARPAGRGQAASSSGSATARLGVLKSTPSLPMEEFTTASAELLDEVPDVGSGPDPVAALPSDYMAPKITNAASVAQGGFEQRYSTHFPKWGTVDEPWLEDAIQKSEILATGFPVQARLQFSIEPNLPFSLILERATPAMAVRAMVSFVEFLASVSTPPRARIVLRSVPHLDRSFHRNVEAALEPYFGDKAQVIRNEDKIEIKFLEWDTVWKDHPFLPIDG